MLKFYCLSVILLGFQYSLAQASQERNQFFAVKFRYLLFTYGVGAEYFLNNKNSIQLVAAGNAYTFSPSIDATVESSLIAEYKYYFSYYSMDNPNRWYVAPYIKYGHMRPGRGDVDDEWYVDVNKDKSIGVVIGRQLFAGKSGVVHFDLFAGSHLNYRNSKENLFLSTTGETFKRNTDKFVVGIRLGANIGISFFKQHENN